MTKTRRQEFTERRRMYQDQSTTRNTKPRVDRQTPHPLETDTALPRTGPQHYGGEPKAPRLPGGSQLPPAWEVRAPRVTNVTRKGTVRHIGQGE